MGLPERGRRRVPGLRREEVALLAGISAEYYLRLEQGRNRLRSLFLVDAERAVYRDREATARRFVAVVRDAVGRGATDPAFTALVAELSALSPQFRELWARHDVVARDTEFATLRHPIVGDLRLHRERLDIAGVAGQSLVVYHPEAGSRDADRLAALLRGGPDDAG